MKTDSQDIFLRNNTGNKSKSTIIDSFVVRTSEFDHIRESLRNVQSNKDVKNVIIIGQRGAGKTTLMHRLNYGIVDDKKLSKVFLPVMFSEEQYNLSDLTNLWETIAIGIEDNYYNEGLMTKIDSIIESENNYEELVFEYLKDFLNKKKKVAILFIENINFFLKKLSDEEKKRLKSILISDTPFRIIGSSTSFNDGSTDFGDLFYDFFETIQLDGLTKEECEKLLIKIGQQYGEEEEIKEIINKHNGRVESLRRLTGGVPRTISYLFQIFLDNENGKAIKDLYLLIDTLTLLYKSELDQLSTQQQKVVDAIAKNWDAISVKEIAKLTRLESKNISSILAYLERNQIIEKIPTSTKNHLYRIKERFMNIWYLMRFGRKNDRKNVIWLVRFFDAWCDESELAKRVLNHIDNLKDGKYDATAAIDMGNTFLSCENIPEGLKEELIKTTNSVLPNKLLKNTNSTQNDLLKEIRNLLKEEKFNEAIVKLNGVQDKNMDYYTLATSVYLMKGDQNKALDTASIAWNLDNQNSFIALILGIIYDLHLNNPEKAIPFYEESLTLSPPHPYAANRLGEIARKGKDYTRAIKFHTQAVKNFKLSLISLGEIYMVLNDFETAESYLKEAVKANVDGVYTVLAKVQVRMNKRKEAELSLIEATLKNEEDSYINLGKFYLTQKRPSFSKAEALFMKAIENGNIEGYNYLAKLFIKKNESAKAIKVYEKSVELGVAESAHQLGHLFNKSKDYKKSDEMFAKAIELGKEYVACCWVKCIYYSGRNEQKSLALNLLKKYKVEKKINSLGFNLLYAKIVLWNGDVKASLNIVSDKIKEIHKIYNEEDDDNSYTQKILSDLLDFFLLLIAKREYTVVLDLFNKSNEVDFKVMLKPIYYLLMDELKNPEYLKAGKELNETIKDLREEVEDLRKKI